MSDPAPRTYNTTEAARIVGVGDRWVRRAIEAGHVVPMVPAVKQGGCAVLSEENLIALRLLRDVKRASALASTLRKLRGLGHAGGKIIVLSGDRARVLKKSTPLGDALRGMNGPVLAVLIPASTD